MRGPPPKPTSLKLMDGNPGKRAINPDEPQPRAVTPRCPAWLLPEQKKFWRELAPMLAGMKVLTEADRNALATLCVAMADLKDAQEKIKQFGKIIKTPSGYAQVSPYVTMQNAAIKQIRAFLQEFGLTPAARSRVVRSTGYGGKENEKEKLKARLFRRSA